jgi:hypothetical protein
MSMCDATFARKSIELNKERFHIDDCLINVLINTIEVVDK